MNLDSRCDINHLPDGTVEILTDTINARMSKEFYDAMVNHPVIVEECENLKGECK